jgi:hypothetical protein
MPSERGQGTVEYVGVLLLVAVLLGAVAGGFGLPQLTAGIASSITRSFLGATGIRQSAQEAAFARPSAADRAAFARASDAAIAPDDRPSLRDVRLALMRQHGDERGRAIYRQLILDALKAAVPGLGGPTLFATATPGLRKPGVLERYLPINSGLSLVAPSSSDPGEVETPVSQPNAHVVTVSEADSALAHALNPGTSVTSEVMDVAGLLPVGRVAGGVFRLAKVAARVARSAGAIAKAGNGLSNAATVAEDVAALEAPDANASPPGSREGDEIVTWLASRCPVHGGSARKFIRTAVVRDGVVILEDIRWPTDAPPPWHPSQTPDKGCT